MALGGQRGYGPREALKRLLRVVATMVAIVGVGTAGYMIIEGWDFLDALYMTVITLSTVGYTEVHDLDTGGEVWTVSFIAGGLVTFGVVTAPLVELAVEGTVRGYFRERRMRREIDALENHYILCGYGRIGREVAGQLSEDGFLQVVVEQDEEVVEECRSDGYPALEGDASDNEMLEAAGVHQAKGLIASVDSDADNVLIVLSARKLNPGLHIVARANSDESVRKLKAAGADRALSLYSISGRRIASLASRPSVVDFLDVVARREGDVEFHVEEFAVSEDSHLAEHSLGELNVAKRTGARVLAIRDRNGKFNTNPRAQDRISAGDTLIVLGTPTQVTSLEKLVEE